MTIIVCGGYGVYWRTIRTCPEEGIKRRMVVHDEPWCGPTLLCCGCGDSWMEGWRMSRPFASGWRGRAIRKNKELWKTALTRKEADKWMMQEMESYASTPPTLASCES